MNQLFEAYKPEEIVKTTRIINTPSDFAKKALFYVQETGYLKSLKSHLSERSKLNSYLFLIVISGSGTFTYKKQSYNLNPNDCVLINCMEHYTHQSDKETPWELLWVHYNGPVAADYYQYHIKTCGNIFHIEDPDFYAHLIYQLIDVHKQKEPTWELVASKLITDLLTNCISKNHIGSKTAEEAITNKLYKVKEYIDDHYKEKIQLEDLASFFYISKYHLCREYKKLFGTTILDYITMKRITQAKELLRFTKLTIEDIAHNSGYPDASYFNKVFQKIENMTASQFRKKW